MRASKLIYYLKTKANSIVKKGENSIIKLLPNFGSCGLLHNFVLYVLNSASP